jgi:hypothetical protein
LKGKHSYSFENILDYKKVEAQICSAAVFCTAPLDFARVQQPKIISHCAGRDSGVPARRISARPSSTTTTTIHPSELLLLTTTLSLPPPEIQQQNTG